MRSPIFCFFLEVGEGGVFLLCTEGGGCRYPIAYQDVILLESKNNH